MFFYPEYSIRVVGCTLQEVGTSGWQSLHANVCKELPGKDEKGRQYLERILAKAKGEEEKVLLALRQGGGAWLGLVEDEQKPHAWSVFGIPWSWGPLSVKQLLVENG